MAGDYLIQGVLKASLKYITAKFQHLNALLLSPSINLLTIFVIFALTFAKKIFTECIVLNSQNKQKNLSINVLMDSLFGTDYVSFNQLGINSTQSIVIMCFLTYAEIS